MMKRGIILLMAGMLYLLASVGMAARGRDRVRAEGYEKQLAAMDPDLVSTFHAATVAIDQDDMAEAARLYQEV